MEMAQDNTYIYYSIVWVQKKINAGYERGLIGKVLKITFRNPTSSIHLEVFTPKDHILDWFILISVFSLNWAFLKATECLAKKIGY